MAMSDTLIAVRNLHKAYGEAEAVRGVDLHVSRGEIFAFLGPNGAGKTTTVEILEGLRTRSAGHVEVLGVDPAGATPQWRTRIGVVLQECRLHPLLTVQESVELYAGYYPSPRPAGDTIELVGLVEQRHQRAGKLSGGQQRRLDVALALVGDPELLFLDEPTTGFDPAARRDAWQMIAGLRQLGKTIFLTTHYMEEAQTLADRVAIIQAGRIVAEGPPGDIGGAATATASIRFGLPPGARLSDLPSALAARLTAIADGFELSTTTAVPDLAQLCGWAIARGLDLPDLEVRRPTLEDVYLELTAAS